MILLIVCVVIAAVLFLVWGVKQNKFGKYYWCYAIAFGLTILTCFNVSLDSYFCRYYCGINMGDCRNSWS